MKVAEIRDRLGLQVVAGEKGLEREALGGYCGDLLSDVMANATQGSVWITIQGHQNIIAVAVLKEMAAILLANGRVPDEESRAKADQEGIPILLSPMKSFQLAGRIYELGIGRE